MTSFECDGCGHHASFHSLENKEEDEVFKRWRDEVSEHSNPAITQRAGNKRRRAIEPPRKPRTTRNTESLNALEEPVIEIFEEDPAWKEHDSKSQSMKASLYEVYNQMSINPWSSKSWTSVRDDPLSLFQQFAMRFQHRQLQASRPWRQKSKQ